MRNFVRVQPNDIAQGRADVAAARLLNVRRAAILLDPTSGSYGLNLAAGFEKAAKRAGIAIVRRGTWDPAANGYDQLAAKVVKGVDGVFLAGGMTGNSARLLPALRKASSGHVRVIAPDGFIRVPELVDAVGPRAPWLVMSVAGQPPRSSICRPQLHGGARRQAAGRPAARSLLAGLRRTGRNRGGLGDRPLGRHTRGRAQGALLDAPPDRPSGRSRSTATATSSTRRSRFCA